KNINSENTRYSVPMSLWFVVNNQRFRKPCGLWSWSSWASWWMAGLTAAMACAIPGVPARGCRPARGERELFVRPSLRRGRVCDVCGGGRLRGGLGRHPLLELRLRHRLHDDRHETVVLAAELRALATVGTGRVDLRPVGIDDPGDRVLLPAEARHPPGVD